MGIEPSSPKATSPRSRAAPPRSAPHSRHAGAPPSEVTAESPRKARERRERSFEALAHVHRGLIAEQIARDRNFGERVSHVPRASLEVLRLDVRPRKLGDVLEELVERRP